MAYETTKNTHTMYSYKKKGAAHVCSLTKRGKQVVEGKIPAWIIGEGLHRSE